MAVFIVLNGELLEEVDCFKYLGLMVKMDSGKNRDYVEVKDDVGNVQGRKRLFSCRLLSDPSVVYKEKVE